MKQGNFNNQDSLIHAKEWLQDDPEKSGASLVPKAKAGAIIAGVLSKVKP